jgi:hypothetical protein
LADGSRKDVRAGLIGRPWRGSDRRADRRAEDDAGSADGSEGAGGNEADGSESNDDIGGRRGFIDWRSGIGAASDDA